MKVIIWGLGQIFERFKSNLSECEIVCLVDSNLKNKGKKNNKSIISPQEILQYEYDYIVIFTSDKFYREISYELVFKIGIDCKKILKWEYYLGQEFYNSKALTDILYKYCKLAKIETILDIEGLISLNRSWKLSGDFTIDLLTKEKGKILENQYENVYFDSRDIKRTYDLVLINESYLENNSLDFYALFAKRVLFVIPIRILEKVKENISYNFTIVNFGGYLFGIRKKTTEILKIFEVTHKTFVSVNDKAYVSIHAGKCNNPDLGYCGDDKGDNISFLNPKINECTALYWIWKNTNFDFIGLNHYRRFFKSPINNFMLQSIEAEELLENYDIIVIEQSHTSKSTIESAIKESVCYEASLDGIKYLYKVFEDFEVQEQKALEYVFQGHSFYPCNMFITSKKVLNKYCSWLFPILFKLIEKIEIKDTWDDYSKRIIGFIAERLLTVWLVQQKYKIKELQLIVVGDGKPYAK